MGNYYWTAYRARLERNDKELKELAKKVIESNPNIEVYFHHEDKFQNNVLFFNGESINSVSFHEVPYYWSGCGFTDHYGGENSSMPFDVDDVMNTFKSIRSIKYRQPNEYFKSKEQYLKWYSFYKRFGITND